MPLVVTVAPPSTVTLPPAVAVLPDIFVIELVTTVGTTTPPPEQGPHVGTPLQIVNV